MRRNPLIGLSVLLLAGLVADTASAQPNLRPGTDVSLGILGPADALAHIGSFPNGEMCLAMATTSCNVGSVNVPWLQAMNADHPMIAFLVTRETGNRMVQISDHSYLKHGFFALSNSQCTPCQQPSNGTFLGVGCSDTYGVGNNGDNYWLAPTDEIDPWTGAWEPICSYFDQGFPPQNPPNDCNGIKSSITPADALGTRVRILDADLDSPGSRFHFQAHYVIIGEPESVRENNLGSRELVPNWNGNSWNINVPNGGNPLIEGSVLQQWTGATVSSNTNGNADGRVYLGFKVIDNGNGTWRYEYALHNRDNARGIKSLRIPVPAGVNLTNVGFHDIDQNVGNDWSFSQPAGEAVWSTTSNGLAWNTMYNFWFDADAPPSSCDLATVEQDAAGPGTPSFTINAAAPGAAVAYGAGEVGSTGNTAVMGTEGGAPTSTNPNFAVTVSGVPTNGFTFLLSGDNSADITHPWGKIYVAGPNFFRTVTTTNGLGEASVVIPISPAMVGTTRYYSYVSRDPGFGGNLQSANGLAVTFCP